MNIKLTKRLLALCCAGALALAGTGCSAEEPSGAANRLEEIQERGYIEVATEPYFSPYEFIDPSKSGDAMYVGSDIELAHHIADSLGVECHIVPLEFSAVLAGVMGFLAQGMTDYSFYNYRVTLVFWAMLGLGAVWARVATEEVPAP